MNNENSIANVGGKEHDVYLSKFQKFIFSGKMLNICHS